MAEIIDSIISLFYVFKYGSIINKHRNFRRKIALYVEIPYPKSTTYVSYVKNEIDGLRVRPYSSGNPFYAIFEKYRNTTRVFIVNEQFQFMY